MSSSNYSNIATTFSNVVGNIINAIGKFICGIANFIANNADLFAIIAGTGLVMGAVLGFLGKLPFVSSLSSILGL